MCKHIKFTLPGHWRASLFALLATTLVFSLCGCAGLSMPKIVSQPTDQAVYLLQTATFKVVASGEQLSYQWQKNGKDIQGATSASYTTPRLTAADNGTQYSVTVTNPKGSEASTPASLGLY